MSQEQDDRIRNTGEGGPEVEELRVLYEFLGKVSTTFRENPEIDLNDAAILVISRIDKDIGISAGYEKDRLITEKSLLIKTFKNHFVPSICRFHLPYIVNDEHFPERSDLAEGPIIEETVTFDNLATLFADGLGISLKAHMYSCGWKEDVDAEALRLDNHRKNAEKEELKQELTDDKIYGGTAG